MLFLAHGLLKGRGAQVEAVPLDRLLGPAMTAAEGNLDDASSPLALSMARPHLEALRPSS
jgi:hypothetical protein